VARVEERNLFYVAPFFLIALLVWVERGVPRPRPWVVVAALVAAALPPLLPFERLIGVPAISDTLALIPWWRLQTRHFALADTWIFVALASALGALAFLLVPRRFALLLPVAVGVYFVLVLKPVETSPQSFERASLGALFEGITTGRRDWIDRRVGPSADVAVVWSGNTSPFTVWENEFFNRSVGAVYTLNGPLPAALAETTVGADRGGVLRDRAGNAVRHRYVLTDGSVSLAGKVVARDRAKGMLLVRAETPLRTTTRVEGLYPNDTWSGRRVSYTRLGCRGGSVAVEVQSDPALFRRAQVVSSGGRRVTVPPGARRVLRVPLRGCRAVFAVSPTAVPAEVTHGRNPDPRVLGIHFNRFEYAP
jgi:hypothetical protein